MHILGNIIVLSQLALAVYVIWMMIAPNASRIISALAGEAHFTDHYENNVVQIKPLERPHFEVPMRAAA